jgi:hypothetical protein
MIVLGFTNLPPPTLQTSLRRTQIFCSQVVPLSSQSQGQTSHSRPNAAEVASGVTAPLHHPQVDALAKFVSPLLAGYFPL